MVLRFPMCIFQFFWYNERKYFLNLLGFEKENLLLQLNELLW